MKTYKNPLNITGIGDPFVLKPNSPRFRGKYYLYATSSPIGFKVWSSNDLINWKEEGLCYDGRKSLWAKDCFWAPECVEYNDKYYLFFSANWKYNPQNEEENFRIGVAVSDNPLGPYIKYEGNPILMHDYPRVSGPGHSCCTFSQDGSEMLIVYHCHTDPLKGGSDRQVCIDRMHFREDGSICTIIPTTDEQPCFK